MKDLQKDEITHVLETNYIGFLSFVWKNNPFVIPITFYFNKADNSLISYSSEGHKVEAMRISNYVSLCVSNITSINNWQSVLVHGKFEELVGAHAKDQLRKFAQGIKKNILIKENKRHQLISDFSSKIMSRSQPIVFRIKISQITGKSRAY